ncbi:SMI1/KNR4 family protein [Streptomyces sp. RerS4]|nr:SMI1/KNR4 family protein [Streptomyces sp. RerS4]
MVRARVRALAERDPGGRRFGADTHRYRLAPPLSEAEVRGFEARHGITLPAAYRSFVTEVADGAAGPAHGLLPLTRPRPEAGEDWAVDDEWADDRRPGRLAAPFSPTGPTQASTAGTLTLAEHGCGVFFRLVLNGPHAGEVWCLDPDWRGFTPRSPDFHHWYTAWLETP